MITGVVLARNEEANIVDCLRSLRPHVSELLLIDMESADGTVTRARPFVDRVLTHPVIPNFDAARNIASSEAACEWLWFLDADERVPERTGHLVREIVRDIGPEVTAITIPFKSYFCDKWIQHCGWWPGYTMARVLKRGHFRFSGRIHTGVEFDGREVRLPPDPELAIEHFSYRSVEHYLEKFNQYTSAESAYLAEQGTGLDWQACVRAMMRDWWQYYEANEGHLDGIHGWILSWLAGQYRWFSHAKLLDRDPGKQTQAAVPENLDAVFQVMHDELSSLRSQTPDLPLGLVWRSPVWDLSGYADDSRVLLRSLAANDRPLAAEPIDWSDRECALPDDQRTLLKTLTRGKRHPFVATITSCIPALCQPDPTASLNILRTTFETDRVPFEWLPIIEEFDEVWGFSEHDRLIFRRSGVAPERIRVLPSYMDASLFTSRGKKLVLPEALAGRFVFLSVFDWQLRKGWDTLLRAYCLEFSAADEVGLLLKVTHAHGHTIELICQQVDELLQTMSCSLSDRPDVVVWDQVLGTTEMAALYRSVDAFVLASRGEGWGRPYIWRPWRQEWPRSAPEAPVTTIS